MVLYNCAVQYDDAWAIFNELGKHNCMHFVDCNKNKMHFELPFAKAISQHDETERKIM